MITNGAQAVNKINVRCVGGEYSPENQQSLINDYQVVTASASLFPCHSKSKCKCYKFLLLKLKNFPSEKNWSSHENRKTWRRTFAHNERVGHWRADQHYVDTNGTQRRIDRWDQSQLHKNMENRKKLLCGNCFYPRHAVRSEHKPKEGHDPNKAQKWKKKSKNQINLHVNGSHGSENAHTTTAVIRANICI